MTRLRRLPRDRRPHRLSGVAVPFGQQVAVRVGGDGDAGVPQPLGHHHQRHPRIHESDRRRRVPQDVLNFSAIRSVGAWLDLRRRSTRYRQTCSPANPNRCLSRAVSCRADSGMRGRCGPSALRRRCAAPCSACESLEPSSVGGRGITAESASAGGGGWVVLVAAPGCAGADSSDDTGHRLVPAAHHAGRWRVTAGRTHALGSLPRSCRVRDAAGITAPPRGLSRKGGDR